MNKKKNNVLGHVLVKDQKARKNDFKNTLRHTSVLQDGCDYNRINLNSITEQTDVESFLETAELAQTDFTAERQNVKIVKTAQSGILNELELTSMKKLHNDHKDFLRIPRRPPWDRSMSPEELAEEERKSFLEWRRTIGLLESKENLVITPYEKNIEFWRQLWRVLERSDVVVQIVDARNPLLFFCEDLCKYVLEIDPSKRNLLLVNKADFLTERQRSIWSEHFEKKGIEAIFFSAIAETTEDTIAEVDEENDEIESQVHANSIDDEHFSWCTMNDVNENGLDEDLCSLHIDPKDNNALDHIEEESSDEEFFDCFDDLSSSPEQIVPSVPESRLAPLNSVSDPLKTIPRTKIVNERELINIFKSFIYLSKFKPHVTIGLVGYPNVGKSSTINKLMKEKRVSVSATPGKTKHFQTLYLTEDVMLCDCPGLVFPAFVASKEEMIVSGILPVDQIRDHVPSVNLVLSLIPRDVLEAKYGVSIPPPPESDHPERSPTSEEFLSVYGLNRGFMTSNGMPDQPRSARYILKDFVNGKLLYCHAPPHLAQSLYHRTPVDTTRKKTPQPTPRQLSVLMQAKSSASVDDAFFRGNTPSFHYNGRKFLKPPNLTMEELSALGVKKPWRLVSKRNTRQKSRKKYAYLDQ